MHRLDLATKTHGRLKKVNAEKKIGVAVFFFGVPAETKNGLKIGKYLAQNLRGCAKNVSSADFSSSFALLKQPKVCIVLF
ncbi:MAG: hypothetical protein IJ892_11835 [Prevotella sp.]|nr:hypothetical protein [Prevotella sp.]